MKKLTPSRLMGIIKNKHVREIFIHDGKIFVEKRATTKKENKLGKVVTVQLKQYKRIVKSDYEELLHSLGLKNEYEEPIMYLRRPTLYGVSCRVGVVQEGFHITIRKFTCDTYYHGDLNRAIAKIHELLSQTIEDVPERNIEQVITVQVNEKWEVI